MLPLLWTATTTRASFLVSKGTLRVAPVILASALLGVACAPLAPDGTAPRIDVSVVNKLVWTNPMTGKSDGLRSAWPLAALRSHTEAFPLAQIKQCPQQPATQQPATQPATACNWGVLKASRTISGAVAAPDAVRLTLDLVQDIERHQQLQSTDSNAGMTIPADVAALSLHRELHQPLNLAYGQVQRIPLDAGVSYEICAQRIDAKGQPIERCPIAFD